MCRRKLNGVAKKVSETVEALFSNEDFLNAMQEDAEMKAEREQREADMALLAGIFGKEKVDAYLEDEANRRRDSAVKACQESCMRECRAEHNIRQMFQYLDNLDYFQRDMCLNSSMMKEDSKVSLEEYKDMYYVLLRMIFNGDREVSKIIKEVEKALKN